MASTLRTPPRFVPTLTTVLDVPDVPAATPPVIASTVVPAETPAQRPGPADTVALPPEAQRSEEELFRIEEHLLHRVLQRIDLSLEERLSDVVSAAVQHQLDAMVPHLRGEIEAALRALVIEALALELGENPGSTPASGA